ncbi:MAG: hypothetical protein VX460_04420 [Planctomycetota bacterium]|nr:hypothetical protein [Planctomycetota bacterium]
MSTPTPRSLGALALLALIIAGCRGWTMDYGEPAAHVEAKDAAAIARRHLGEKIVVRGQVVSVDVSDAENCAVRLEEQVIARFGAFERMAKEFEVGEVATIAGIVESVDAGVVILDPATGRDPLAPFEPDEP